MTGAPPRSSVAVTIGVVFDTVCPWSFVGKRRLERALARRPAMVAAVEWIPFLLAPDMPPEGIDRTAYLIKRFGSEARIRRIYGALEDLGQSVAIDFAFERIRHTPNSLQSHRLVRFAGRHGLAGPVVEALFRRYFLDGQDTGDSDVLAAIGTEAGLDEADLRRYLAGTEDRTWVFEANARARRLGINGVPSFVFDRNLVISGAQEPAVLARMLDVARVMAARPC